MIGERFCDFFLITSVSQIRKNTKITNLRNMIVEEKKILPKDR
jgi:hypothetical protein